LDVTGENDLVGFGSMIDLIIGHSSGLTLLFGNVMIFYYPLRAHCQTH
jgi:hypothetical protein